MSEKVIKSLQLKEVTRPVIVEPPRIEFPEEAIELEDGEQANKEPSGPSPEELERMVEEKTQEAEKKSREIIEKARKEAEDIKGQSENWAFDQVKKANEEYEARIKEAQLEAKHIEDEAREKGKGIIEDAQKEAERITKEAQGIGFEQGRDQGYQEGNEEIQRLVAVVHKVTGDLIEQRTNILAKTENELINLVLMISNKIIKTMTETQKRVVYDNVLAALSKLRVRSEVTIRINPSDIYSVTKYKKDFIEMVEGVENIRILEDPNVDKGGCIVTSEFGSIDARISTQLAEIEDQIKKLSPIKNEE